MSDFAVPWKCPAGCFAYVDECTNVSFSHYLSWKFGLTFFNGQRKYLNGERKDWPITSVQLRTFQVMIADAEKGLCFMMCASHGHGLMQSIVHVPQNPVLETLVFRFLIHVLQPYWRPMSSVLEEWASGPTAAMLWQPSEVTLVSVLVQLLKSTIAHSTMNDSSTACTIAMKHCPDIYEVCQNRFADMPGGDDELKRVSWLYDVLDKPSAEKVKLSLFGASSVDIHHSFLMNERTFHRDTRDCENDSNERQLESWLLALTFVHPPTANGCAPVILSSFYNVEKHAITEALLHLLVHCPVFHEVLLHSFDSERQDYVTKLLKFAQSGNEPLRHSQCKRVWTVDKWVITWE